MDFLHMWSHSVTAFCFKDLLWGFITELGQWTEPELGRKSERVGNDMQERRDRLTLFGFCHYMERLGFTWSDSKQQGIRFPPTKLPIWEHARADDVAFILDNVDEAFEEAASKFYWLSGWYFKVWCSGCFLNMCGRHPRMMMNRCEASSTLGGGMGALGPCSREALLWTQLSIACRGPTGERKVNRHGLVWLGMERWWKSPIWG